MSAGQRYSRLSQESLPSSDDTLLEEGKTIEKEVTYWSGPPEKSSYKRLLPYFIHIVIFITYTFSFLFMRKSWLGQKTCRSGAYTPVGSAEVYQMEHFEDEIGGTGLFRGEPRPELDKAWGDLIANINIRLTKNELDKLNRTAIPLADGSGYYGQLSVYHHLHCLKYLRQVLFSDYYPGIKTPGMMPHVDHCVDDIRQALTCHADTSIVTFDWVPNLRRAWTNFHTDQTCVNWKRLDGWASERSFSVYDQKSLVHPEMGLLYPLVDGEYEKLAHGEGIHIVWPEGFVSDPDYEYVDTTKP